MKKKEFVERLKDLGVVDANGTYDAFSKVITPFPDVLTTL